jgi:ketosteroid isomerase-like protein
MKSKLIFQGLILTLVLHLSLIKLVSGQSSDSPVTTADLYKEIAKMDSVVFNAFNARDTDRFKNMFTEDLEFYHDKGGLTGYEQTIEFMRSTAKTDNGLRRDLVKGSLEVYPIPGYGAMETGSHTFCHMENGKKDCGTFKFVHIWQKKNGTWKISRVVSYGH